MAAIAQRKSRRRLLVPQRKPSRADVPQSRALNVRLLRLQVPSASLTVRTDRSSRSASSPRPPSPPHLPFPLPGPCPPAAPLRGNRTAPPACPGAARRPGSASPSPRAASAHPPASGSRTVRRAAPRTARCRGDAPSATTARGRRHRLCGRKVTRQQPDSAGPSAAPSRCEPYSSSCRGAGSADAQ